MQDQYNNCPYCNNLPGVGDQHPKTSGTPFDVLLHEAKDVILTPTKGMLLPGYFLAITKRHYSSFAELGGRALSRFDEYLQDLLGALAPIFGDYFSFEHGSAEICSTEACGPSIEHAHFHLIPAANNLESALLQALPWEELSSISKIPEDLASDYALFGLRGGYYISRSPKIPSQWIRRKLVEILSLDIN